MSQYHRLLAVSVLTLISVLDGVFTEAPGGALAFHAAPGPSDAEA